MTPVFSVTTDVTYTDVILDDGSGPTVYEQDHLYVRATSRRRAIVLAVRAWRRKYKRAKYRSYIPDFIKDNLNPFTTTRAILL